YTANWDERDYLKKIGWKDEGEAFSFTSPEPPQSGPLSPA
ncbi:glycoside hydrolase, family 25, partial [Lactococcus cremoris]|nr:glycoside hydrolase, family 25 [Lactococcus cremoris]